MDRRTFLTALLGTPALAAVITACGDTSSTPLRPRGTVDTVPGTDTPGSTGSTVVTTVPPADGVAHPTGANDVVLRFGYEGGFVAPDSLFSRTPTMLITGDGRVLTPNVVPAVFPGPLVQGLNVQTISEQGLQKVLAAANTAHLLAPAPSYDLPNGVGIADAADTVVTIAANGTTFVHTAYALDITASDSMASTPARDALAKFVASLGDLAAIVGADQLGAPAPFVPPAYRIRATPYTPQPTPDQPAPTILAWPASVGVALSSASSCVVVDTAKLGDVFVKATQITYFTDAGVTYQLAVAPVLPGDTGC
jgi:hypothetical protein